jgi:predicted nucleotidyltransferase
VTHGAGATRLLATLRQTADVLSELGQPWALVGGLAVSIRSEPRFTRDVDLAVSVAGDEDAEALVSTFVARGFRLRFSLEQEALGRLAAVRLAPPSEPDEGIVVDLLFASSGIEAEICQEAEPLEIVPGLAVPVATAGHLVIMKLLALAPDRPQDEVDLQALLATLAPGDRERARAAAARIEQIGANRSKALREELERRLGERRP